MVCYWTNFIVLVIKRNRTGAMSESARLCGAGLGYIANARLDRASLF